ncbi:MAG TPA: hypothetical protein PLE85_04280 [Bacteroidales bacterium]|nr:hypothetical protein [Bacteroidales bacterium]
MDTEKLLAVDLGIRTGFAVYTNQPLILAYGSRNYGNASRLRRAAASMVREIPDLHYLVIEGGGPLAQAWSEEARRLGIAVQLTSADVWRKDILYSRERRSGIQAKQQAIQMARRVIDHLNGPKPQTALQDDAAEAILCGWWALGKLGWLDPLPRL